MRPILFCLAGLASCSIIFPRLLPPECSTGAATFCRDNEIISCVSDFEVGSPCDAGQECNDGTGEAICVAPICGDNLLNNNEQCDDGNTLANDGCEADCTLACGQGTGARSAIVGPNNHCYLGFSQAAVIAWQAAQTQCESHGGYLVTIDDNAENTLAKSILPQPELAPWIGLQDFDNEEDLTDGIPGDDFVWVNQQPNVFRAFQAPQPDDIGGLEDCVHFVTNNTNWNDIDCAGAGFNTSYLCELEPVTCGDHVLQPLFNEACDDGNLIAGDGCDAACQIEPNVCGNGVVEVGETCEDGNVAPGDGCNQCQNEAGHFFEIEPNDDGTPNLPPDPNNDPQLGGNDFDPTQVNVLPGANLLIHGSISVLGDEDYYSLTNNTGAPLTVLAQVFVGGLGQCVNFQDTALNVRASAGATALTFDDNGVFFCPESSVTIPAGETFFFGVLTFAEEETVNEYLFSLSTCGDGVLVVAEQCDDGNQIEGDGCDSNCLLSGCGNNRKESSEACDDGDNTNGNGCTAQCILEFCGDGVVNNVIDFSDTEQCDDGGTIPADGCDATCQVEDAFVCTQATSINLGDTLGDNTTGTAGFAAAIGEANLGCFPGDGEGRENLFTFVAATTGVMTVDLTSQVDLVLYARSTCADENSELGCADFAFDGTESIDFPVTAGDSVTLFVDGFGFDSSEQGPYTLTVAIN